MSCSVDQSGSGSTIVLQMPKNIQKSSQVSAFSSKACFAVNISGDKIPSTEPGDCDPQYGEFAGLVAGGESIELQVSRGKNRTIDLFYIVSEDGCSDFDVTEGLAKTFGSNKVYRIAHHEGIDFNKSVVKVELRVQFPSPSNTLSALHSTPDSCKIGDDPVNKMALREAGIAIGAAHGFTENNTFVNIRIKKQSLNINEHSGWKPRLLPARLGDK